MINNTNLFSESYTAIKNFLEGISGLDTKNRFKVNWIHTSMPRINDKGFSGYPFIIIQIDNGEDKKSFGSTSQKNFSALITIYSKDATNLDTISDKIYSNLKDETKLTEFSVNNLESSPISFDLDMKGEKILNRAMNILFKKRI
jgi:hypothetical protein